MISIAAPADREADLMASMGNPLLAGSHRLKEPKSYLILGHSDFFIAVLTILAVSILTDNSERGSYCSIKRMWLPGIFNTNPSTMKCNHLTNMLLMPAALVLTLVFLIL